MATLDFSVADISDNVVEILASNGDVYCGGSDIDKMLAYYIMDEFKKSNGIDLSKDVMAVSRVFEAAEKAKVELSQTTTTEINLPYITVSDGIPVHLMNTLTRAKFEQLIDSEINNVVNYGKEALQKAGVSSEDLDGILLVGGSTRIPKVQEELIKAFGDKLIKNVNPDEVVSLGAATQANILTTGESDILLLDVTAIPYGIRANMDSMVVLIDANTTIPSKKSEIFTTAADNQSEVPIEIFQGFRPMASDNKMIGRFVLDGIMPARRGVPQIEVTFDIDANGILSVSATDKGTGKEQHITISNATGLSDDDVKRMKEEAEKFAEEDKKKKEQADKLNSAETLAFQTEKYLEEFSDKLDEVDKSEIKAKLEALKKELETKNLDTIELKKKELEDSWNAISSKMYKTDSQEQPTNTGFDFGDMVNGMNNPFAGKK